ncbi:hypothetical protein JXI42_05055 [bacterium]|nr:hypothetical protein [bacterium]
MIILILITGFVSFLFMESVYFGFFAMIILTFGCGKFFFPSWIELNDSGVTEAYLGMKKSQKWKYFKRYSERKDSIVLSPFEKPHWLERYRAWYIYPKSEKILDFIAKKITLNGKNYDRRNNA